MDARAYPFDQAVARWVAAHVDVAYEDIDQVMVKFEESQYSETSGYTADAEVTVDYRVLGSPRSDGRRYPGKPRQIFAATDPIEFAAMLMNEYSAG